MGYTTNFVGRFVLDKPMEERHAKYLDMFSYTRRMKRDPRILETIDDPYRKAVNLPIGIEGEYFVNSPSNFGQIKDESVIDYNSPPNTQPSLWCQWVPSEDRMGIEWNGGEKFYYYIEWLEYIMDNFLRPWNYKLSGLVKYQGEDEDDCGMLYIRGGRVLNSRQEDINVMQ